jgi:hypothetical protein
LPVGGFSLNENLEEERIDDQIYSLISPVAGLEIGIMKEEIGAFAPYTRSYYE